MLSLHSPLSRGLPRSRRVPVSRRLLVALPAMVLALPLLAAPDRVFVGATVLTLDDESRRAEAVAVEAGRITAIGSEADILAMAGAETQRVDLGGGAMLPGFVDSHSHASLIGLQALSANLLPPPDGEGASVASLQRILADYAATEPRLLKELGWIIGFGYDDSQLAEQRHPTRQDLDAVAADVPMVIIHQSGHLGVANSLGLERAGVTAATVDPDGGVFRREEGRREPNGVAEEYAFFQILFAALADMDDALRDDMALAGTRLMARYGYTTAQEGRADAATLTSLARLARQQRLPIDVVAYPDMLVVTEPEPTRGYEGGFRVGGVKLTIDGSPQGLTAWLSEPYYRPPPQQPEGYRGYAAVDADTVNESILKAFARGWQPIVHANGDAAIDALIDAVRRAREAHPERDLRPVLIHGQTLRRDQVTLLRELEIFPSLFPMHTFYWGDWHREVVLGPVRGDNISPTGWVLEEGLRFGTHHDAPVALPDSMRVLSATVTRRSRSGDILGPEHRVDVETALKAMTLWPAWQHFEENDKGSLEVGKLADFVLLSEDPLAVDVEDLDTLTVRATYKKGVRVYPEPDAP